MASHMTAASCRIIASHGHRVVAVISPTRSPMQATLEAQIELLQKFLAGQSQQGGPPPSTPPPASQQPPTTASGGSGQVGTMVTGGVLRDRDGADGVHGSVSAVIKEEATLVVADKDGSKVHRWATKITTHAELDL